MANILTDQSGNHLVDGSGNFLVTATAMIAAAGLYVLSGIVAGLLAPASAARIHLRRKKV